MHPVRKRLTCALGLAVVVTGLAQFPASANTSGNDLVISEVYLNGGSTGATYTNKYAELYNPTDEAIPLTGLSLQYRSATGTAAGTAYALSGSVPAKGYYVVQGGSNGANGSPVPSPGQTTGFNPSGTSGTVMLVRQTGGYTAPTGSVTGNSTVLDLYGYGTSNTFETAAGPAASVSTSVQRSATNADTDNNAADFAASAPTPGAGYAPPPPAEDAGTKTIAEIQGTDASASPLVGKTVVTRGVVTADYDTGGYNGFYIQTPGTGGATDQTPGASDAIFVYGTAATAKVTKGQYVEVKGQVTEFDGTTEITAAAADVTVLDEAVTAPTGLSAALPVGDAAKEAHEGELLAPTGPFVVTNSYASNQYGEIGLAVGDKPLVAPTEVADAQDTAAVAAVKADNLARAIALDDGASTNYLTTGKDTDLPWLRKTNPVRVGAHVTFKSPVVLEYRNGIWKLQPTAQVTDDGSSVAAFENTRTAAPEDVGGDVRLATFNVLNYFPTTAEEFVGMGGGRTCTYYNDRAGNPVTANSCSPSGPRGAANAANLSRQQVKIVTAINKLGAGIVSLEEIENSVKFGKDRDFAVKTLVDALNAAAGSPVWAYVPSPAASGLPAVSAQDVIRTAFIYKPAQVRPVGISKVLVGSTAFTNARQPLAQAFKATGAKDSTAFAVIVNHFKSKGSGTDDGTGQGNANPDRIAQATALADFADSFKTERGLSKVFLTGDFNAYSMEDPIQVLEDRGYHLVDSTVDPDEETYSFDGTVGSLDHVFANTAAQPMVTGADVWNINSPESVGYEYSRYNYNSVDLYEPNQFKASDHDPEIVGLDLAQPVSDKLQLNLLTVNDFHGRINANTVKWAGTVEQLTDSESELDTLLVGAGDLIGASEFASSVADDQPTIDMFNALGLDASAVGNHEFDKGWADLRDRVIGSEDAPNAQWDYLGANVYKKGTQTPAMQEFTTFEIEGVTIGVIGAVTEETKSLVSPGGITELEFGDPVDAVNRVAGELSDGDAGNGEADVIVAAFHAGATQGTGSSYADQITKGGEFAKMANLDASVDVIVNGHTHQSYAWDAPVPGSATKTRPIIQTGEYGTNVGQIKLTIDKATGNVDTYVVRNVARTTADDATLVSQYPRVAKVKQIVDAALAKAAEVGNKPVGSITADVTRALSGGSYVNGKWAGGATEDRASESAMGDLVANALRDGLPSDFTADIGIVNPGGLRAELRYAGSTASNPANTDGVVTYAEANAVLPFVNNVWTVQLKGSDLKSVLEEQWQPDGASRPFLALGLSDNVQVTQDASKPRGSRITSVIIDGEPLDTTKVYTVSTFSFLGTGGDNFFSFKNGASKDTGLVDRDLWIRYLQENPAIAPDFARQQVAESGMPAAVTAGQQVAFTLSKLNLTSLGAPENTAVTVYLRKASGVREVGEFPVTNGVADISFTAPEGLIGTASVVAIAKPSGTQVGLPLTESTTSVSATAEDITYGEAGSVLATVTSDWPVTGEVEVLEGETSLGKGMVSEGTATVAVPATALDAGEHVLTVRYLGDAQNSASSTTVALAVAKATSTTTADGSPSEIDVDQGTSTLGVVVDAGGVEPTGDVEAWLGDTLLTSATLVDGAADLVVGPFDTVGSKSLEVRYVGEDNVSASDTTTTVNVVKVASQITATAEEMTYGKAGSVAATVTSDLPVSGDVELLEGETSLGKGTVSGGKATVAISATALDSGEHTLTVRYLGDAKNTASSTTVPLTVAKASSFVSATATPSTVKVKKGAPVIRATVFSDGTTPAGNVEAWLGNKLLSSAPLVDGAADLKVGPFDTVGSKSIEIRYLGSKNVGQSAASTTVTVVKATPSMKVTTAPRTVHVRTTKPVVTVNLAADGFTVGGRVDITTAGQTWTRTLSDGQTQLTLPAYSRVGDKSVTVEYLGSALAESVTRTVTISVVK